MYPVTHAAIAVGSVWAGRRIFGRARENVAPAAAAIDYRFVALGALVPDLIDKPLAWIIFPGSLPDSHVYGHTLMLALAITAAGAIAARAGELRLLAVGLGCLTHPLVDPVLVYPQTLFWPLFGTEFARPTFQLGFYQRIIEASLIATAAVLWTANLDFRAAVRRLVETGRIARGRA